MDKQLRIGALKLGGIGDMCDFAVLHCHLRFRHACCMASGDNFRVPQSAGDGYLRY